jgi:hypothetical protein
MFGTSEIGVLQAGSPTLQPTRALWRLFAAGCP